MSDWLKEYFETLLKNKEKQNWSIPYREDFQAYYKGKAEQKWIAMRESLNESGIWGILKEREPISIFCPGCFVGGLDIHILSNIKGQCLSVDLIDDECMSDASEEAGNLDLKIEYRGNTDCNYFVPEKQSFDLIISQNILHHLWNYEQIFPNWLDALKPDGYIYGSEYVGGNRLIGKERNVTIANIFWRLLPQELRLNEKGDLIEQVGVFSDMPSVPEHFEAIRSEEIMSFVEKTFRIIYKKEEMGFIYRMDSGKAYPAKWKQNNTIVELLEYLDRLLIEKGLLKGEFIRFIGAK